MPDPITIRCNGETKTIVGGLSVADFLAAEALEGGRVAVLVNGDVVRKDERAVRQLRHNDTIEILVFAGGG